MDLFEKYPEIGTDIRGASLERYKRQIREPVTAHRQRELEEINKRAEYFNIEIKTKEGAHVSEYDLKKSGGE